MIDEAKEFAKKKANKIYYTKKYILLTILHIILAPRAMESLWGYTLFLPKDQGHW